MPGAHVPLPPRGKLPGLMRPKKMGSVLESPTPTLYLGPSPHHAPPPTADPDLGSPPPHGRSQCRLSGTRACCPGAWAMARVGVPGSEPAILCPEAEKQSPLGRDGSAGGAPRSSRPAGVRGAGRGRPQVWTGAPVALRRSWPRLCVCAENREPPRPPPLRPGGQAPRARPSAPALRPRRSGPRGEAPRSLRREKFLPLAGRRPDCALSFRAGDMSCSVQGSLHGFDSKPDKLYLALFENFKRNC